jgi:hypothetical protein
VKRSLPWLASILAAVLLFTPSYGIGVAVAPLTIVGSYVALSSAQRSFRIRLGAALNVFIVVAGLTLLTMIWWPSGWFVFVLAWFILIVMISLLASRSLHRREALPSDRA